MYKQTLYKVLKDYIKPKVLNRMNRYKKWDYGYNKEHDLVVISKTGEIGEIYEIQNLKIALPKQKDVVEFEDDLIERRQLEIADENGIKLTNHSLYLYGECEDKDACKAFAQNNS